MAKEIMLSGIQPSGDLHLGNYLGAIKGWVDRTDEYDNYYFMADLHTLTVRQDPEAFRKRALEQLALYIACGLDPEKNTLFYQSHVPAHAQLGWVLDCYTMFGELSRMTQFKDKSRKNADNINAGLFTYPALMAADILLYQADYVPVGEDQRQHVELTRDIANRFNGVYGPTFKVPKAYVPKEGARIYGLSTPGDKMSKSVPDGCIFLMDTEDVINKKVKKAVTDADTEKWVRYDPVNKPGVSNMMNIVSALTGKSFEEIEKDFEGMGYGKFKPAVAEVIIDALRPIREEAEKIMNDEEYLRGVYRKGAEKASVIAEATLKDVYDKVGLTYK